MMKRITAYGGAALLVFAVACNGEPAEQPPAQTEAAEAPAPAEGELTMPDWYQIDEEAGTVHLEIIAGSTPDNNHWNYNGFYGGDGTIVVPEGFEVTITFTNEDPAMAHSIGVDSRTSNFPANFQSPEPLFEGGMSSNPTSLTESTLTGETETITFVASEAGEFSLVCYVPGHAAVGMWMPFNVSAEGEAGVIP